RPAGDGGGQAGRADGQPRRRRDRPGPGRGVRERAAAGVAVRGVRPGEDDRRAARPDGGGAGEGGRARAGAAGGPARVTERLVGHRGSSVLPFVLVDMPRPHLTLITRNRPERMNAMAFDVMIPFREALEEAGRDNDTRVVVVTGAGRGFCSGADLENPGDIPGIDGLTLPTIALRSMELLDDVVR